MSHTPGPWEYGRKNWRGEDQARNWYVSGNRHTSQDQGDECEVATAVCVVEGNETSYPVCLSNARLIAAAPELLEACKLAYDTFHATDVVPKTGRAIDALSAAIDKAVKGVTP